MTNQGVSSAMSALMTIVVRWHAPYGLYWRSGGAIRRLFVDWLKLSGTPRLAAASQQWKHVHSDQALIDRSLAGESDAFGELVRRHQDRLFGSLSHLLGSVHDAADVAQDAFVLAYRNLSRFRGQSAFYSWLFRIAYNAAVNHQRRHRRKSQSLDSRREDLGDEPIDGSQSSDPAAGMHIDERTRIVREALGELGEDYRNALILKEIEGLPYEEIAAVMECPVGTVRSRIHRARHELRDKLTRVMKESDL